METLKLFTGKNFMRNLVGMVILLAGFALTFCCLFMTIPTENKEIRVQVLTFAIGAVMLVGGYYFTTSQSSTDKNELLKPTDK